MLGRVHGARPFHCGPGRLRPRLQIYIAAAKAPVWSTKFLATPYGGPFLFPLLAKLCLRNLRAIVLVQSAIAAGAWLFLAGTIAGKLRAPAARWLAVIALLLLALSPSVLLWNATISTESLSVSLSCVAIALWIRLVGGVATRLNFAAFIAVLVALACTRDTNAYLLVVIFVISVLVAFGRRDLRRRGTVIAAVCAIAAVGSIAASNHADRWYNPLNETISIRLLGSPMATRYLVAHGMPLDANVRRLHAPHMYPFLRHDLLYAPKYEPYRTWALNRGQATYTSFLLTHPAWDLAQPFDDRDRLLAPSLRGYGRLFHDEPRGAFNIVGAIGNPASPMLIEIWIGLAALAAVALGRFASRPNRRLLLAIGVVAILVVPHYLLVWHEKRSRSIGTASRPQCSCGSCYGSSQHWSSNWCSIGSSFIDLRRVQHRSDRGAEHHMIGPLCELRERPDRRDPATDQTEVEGRDRSSGQRACERAVFAWQHA